VIVAGKANPDIARAAAKKFSNKKIDKSYVQWWRHKFERSGAVKAPRGRS
jgi:hypothetical protein